MTAVAGARHVKVDFLDLDTVALPLYSLSVTIPAVFLLKEIEELQIVLNKIFEPATSKKGLPHVSSGFLAC